jgi:hypothetical protein
MSPIRLRGASDMSKNDDECDAEEEELARIVDELLQRIRHGDTIDSPACLKRHPRHAEELKRLAPTMVAFVKVLVEKRGLIVNDRQQ